MFEDAGNATEPESPDSSSNSPGSKSGVGAFILSGVHQETVRLGPGVGYVIIVFDVVVSLERLHRLEITCKYRRIWPSATSIECILGIQDFNLTIFKINNQCICNNIEIFDFLLS